MAPAFLGKIHPRFQTPANALLVNTGFGIVALLTNRTGHIIILSVFGALTLYIVSMVALLRLRKTEPALERSFKVPMYPLFPITALVIAIISIVAMIYYNRMLALVYFLILGVSYGAFKLFSRQSK